MRAARRCQFDPGADSEVPYPGAKVSARGHLVTHDHNPRVPLSPRPIEAWGNHGPAAAPAATKRGPIEPDTATATAASPPRPSDARKGGTFMGRHAATPAAAKDLGRAQDGAGIARTTGASLAAGEQSSGPRRAATTTGPGARHPQARPGPTRRSIPAAGTCRLQPNAQRPSLAKNTSTARSPVSAPRKPRTSGSASKSDKAASKGGIASR